MSEAHLSDLGARSDTHPLPHDTSSLTPRSRVASRQSLETSMSPEEYARFERQLLYTGEPRSRRASIRSLEDLNWASARQSPAGEMIEMSDILGARPITPA